MSCQVAVCCHSHQCCHHRKAWDPLPSESLFLGVPTSLHQPDYEFSIIKKKKKRMANDVSVRNYGTVSKFRREISGMS